MKTCLGCGEAKPLADYYAKSSRCKPCAIAKNYDRALKNKDRQLELQRAHYARNRDQYATKSAEKYWADPETARAAARIRYADNAEAIRAYMSKWNKENRERSRAYGRRYEKENPEKVRAHTAVKLAIKRGTLKQSPCEVCGAAKAHAHHDDYSKPLEVRWLCQAHHNQHHAATKAAAAEIYV